MDTSVHTENSYKLWIYLYNRIYFSIVYLHKDHMKTKALLQLISSLYVDIIRMKEKDKREKRKIGHMIYSNFFLQKRDNILSKACQNLPESVVLIISTVFQKKKLLDCYFFYKNIFQCFYT